MSEWMNETVSHQRRTWGFTIDFEEPPSGGPRWMAIPYIPLAWRAIHAAEQEYEVPIRLCPGARPGHGHGSRLTEQTIILRTGDRVKKYRGEGRKYSVPIQDTHSTCSLPPASDEIRR